MDRWYEIADTIVLLFGLLLMAAIIGVLLVVGIIVFMNGGVAVGLATFLPVAILVTAAAFALHDWYRAL